MNCWYHRWMLSRAADRREAAPPVTQAHLAGCDDCRAYADFCARLPRTLAAAVPATADTTWLEQRIFAQTTRAAGFQGLEKNPQRFPSLGKSAELFSKPWKPALAAAALLLLAALGWQQWHAVQTQQQLAALQTMQSFYETAAEAVGPAALQNHVTTAVEYLGGLLPVATPPSTT